MKNYKLRNCTSGDIHHVYEMIVALEGENPGIEEFTEVFFDKPERQKYLLYSSRSR